MRESSSVQGPSDDRNDLDAVGRVIYDALYNDTWIEEKPNQPTPDWHRRFAHWQAMHAARLASDAIHREFYIR